MARAQKDFGRRAPPVKTSLPEGLKDPTPQTPVRKRSIAVALLGAGAVAAAAVHYLESGPEEETCVAVAQLGTGPSPTGLPIGGAPAIAAGATGGGIGGPQASDPGCPPGTRRTSHSSSSSRRGFFSGWHWSSGSSSSGSSASHFSSSGSSTTPTHVSSSAAPGSISRGGFGSTGAFHASGGS